jgi:tetratricopeptide (TPR) repeat protein
MKRVGRVIATVLLLCTTSSLHAENFPYDYVTYEGSRKYVPIPRTYTTTRIIRYIGAEYGAFSSAQDLFIDSKDLLYVVDTDRNRILKMSPEGEVLAVFLGDKKGFKKPAGVFVDDAGDIFVADTENSRIVHLSPQGEVVEEFGEPRSGILGTDFKYYPQKLFISATGFIYVIRGETIMILDAQNNFRGYLGQTDVGFRFTDFLVNIIASEEQKAIIANRYAARYTNLVVDNDGIIYATCHDEHYGQIKKLNAVGENIYKEQFYGERDYAEGIGMRLPQLVDIAVSDSGIITTLEINQSKIFQYDQEGNLVAVFGGEGTTKGRFLLPKSIALDSSNRIYVLENNAIQVLSPTYFIQTVHKAIAMYAQGRYEDAYTLWKEVQRMDENYRLAASGIAKALHKQGKWDQALVQYHAAEDPAGYSTTFVEFRHERFRRIFTIVAAVLVAVLFVLYRIVILLYRKATKILDNAETSTRGSL